MERWRANVRMESSDARKELCPHISHLRFFACFPAADVQTPQTDPDRESLPVSDGT